eukprot:TRINITY_DN2982_c0_g1_i2.p1 TRINITY_DN2982_c0_g1~~TRINITY_DN2982_c0_g1_i2.p1  ORF type:complete len:191 (+),score=18.97 TRINITY_DN2982_c0_g1_i2:340-912(+)
MSGRREAPGWLLTQAQQSLDMRESILESVRVPKRPEERQSAPKLWRPMGSSDGKRNRDKSQLNGETCYTCEATVLVHELVHAFDFARAKIDTSSCVHIACTEIRAWNMSGECELWTKWWETLGEDMVNRKQRCVREGALASLLDNERCRDPAIARAAIEEAWQPCWHDHWPFTTKPDMDNRYRDSPMLSG